MATKEENIQRLRELATRLGRDPDVSGSAAELSQRVMEWEEEAEAEHLPAVENDSDESIVPPGIGQKIRTGTYQGASYTTHLRHRSGQ